MSKLSLYENNWINLVFENRNKEYGAFQLRQETAKTSIRALALGIFLCTTLIVVPNILHLFNGKITPTETNVWEGTIIQLDEVYQEEKKPEAAAPAPPAAQVQKTLDAVNTKQLINPTVVKAPESTPTEKYTNDRIEPTDKTGDGMTVSGSGSEGGVVGGTGTGNGTDIGTGTSDSGTEILTDAVLDKKPQFPGGIEKFYRYVGTHFNSPSMDESVRTVRIFVSFVVEKDGSMSNIKVLNKPGAALEREAIRVLNSIKTKWLPGIYNSKPVRTAYNLPIVVQVE